MIKTQVQIPDHLFREAKRIAAEYEMSFADVVRRGLERVVPSFPPREGSPTDWELPQLDLGLQADPFTDPDWRPSLYASPMELHEPAAPKAAAAHKKRRKKPR
ncbi:MAG: hypothetical protein ABIU84_04090 [Thermoanaerobaculia bacterium]